ncbi:ABC transporter substrate-binding protein [Falsigemmobacter intermedius]|uniref:ABC transporter substrate-binding protein n=1 Tax=Falsigemmobacter intermedius TaxID=1553448 RepID=A0A3S3YF66_9RHOB|nr:ABC transporter substrate-binding protein [Falsigemmobacter intermedius]RWY42471.1 ABC transporter substrate-binding protein [Falsigemmobacter intermedius]
MFNRLKLSVAALALVAAPALAANDSVIIGIALEPPTLDPTSGAAAAIREVTQVNIYEGLTRFGPDGSILPALAKSWDIEENGKVWIFHLNEGVKFHDGSDFDAEDVKFTLERTTAEGSTNAQKQLFNGIETVEVVDAKTVKITLKAPDANFAFNMAWGDAVMMAPESVADNATKPVGTGPYKLGEWVKGDRIDLVANPDYWGAKPAIEKATFKIIADPTAALNAMMAEDVDVFPIFPAPETLAQFEGDSRFQVLKGTTEGETILGLNNQKAPLDNVKVREAIAHAVNRQEIIDGAMFGLGTPIGTHFAPHHPAYVDLTAQSAFDPEKAKALLKEAGVENLKLRLALPPPMYARRGGEIIAAQLRNVGIETEISNLEWAQWLEQVFKGKDFDLTIISHVEPMDINIYARPDYYFGYGKPEFVAILDELAVTADDAKRTELLQSAQKMIADDYVNVYLFQLAKAGVAKAGLKGLWPNSPAPIIDIGALSWE